MSSNKSVELEISLEKLTVKFKGDLQIAERLQGEVVGALNNLASAQSKMLASPARPAPPSTQVIVAPSGRRRRRRKVSDAPGIDPSLLEGLGEGENGNGDGDAGDVRESRRPRRAAGAGPRAQLDALKHEGFFAQGRQTNAAVRAALARKGHTFQSNEVNPPLVAMTKEGLLQREMLDGQWVYFDTPQ